MFISDFNELFMRFVVFMKILVENAVLTDLDVVFDKFQEFRDKNGKSLNIS